MVSEVFFVENIQINGLFTSFTQSEINLCHIAVTSMVFATVSVKNVLVIFTGKQQHI